MKERILTPRRIADFRSYLINSEKSAATVEKYTRDVRAFQQFAAQRSLDKGLILAYKADLVRRYAVRSANSMLAALNAFLRYAGWQELCVKQLKLQKDAYCEETRELTKKEYVSLVDTAERMGNRRLSLVVQTICGTGIRVSELQCITVEAVRRGEAVVRCKGKIRRILIISALRKKLLRYAAEHKRTGGVLFTTRTGKPLNRSNIWREMKALCLKAGVQPQKVFPHNLRHLFARTFYSLEKDIAKLADILGHSNINTTRIYIMTTVTEHRRRMESMRLIL